MVRAAQERLAKNMPIASTVGGRSGVVSHKPRLAIYTHDTFGMGHIRRCFNIIEAVCKEHPDWPILFISGSPALNKFFDRPKNVDVMKLPTLATTGKSENQPPNLPIPTRDIISIRKRVIKSALAEFKPSVFLVDNFALGARGELLNALEMLTQTNTQVVLGLRDIVEDPESTRRSWKKGGVYDSLTDHYDRILVYGEQEIFDAAEQYQLEGAIKEKIDYCGYVTRPSLVEERVRNFEDLQWGNGEPKLLLTVGGGGDGYPLINTFLDAASKLPDFACLVVTGPMMGASDFAFITERVASFPHVTLIDYTAKLDEYMSQSDVLITMGGYNTASELIALRRRAIIVPRDWRFGEHAIGKSGGGEMEQRLRALALEREGFAKVLMPEELSAETLAAAVREEWQDRRPRNLPRWPVNGAATAATLIADMALADHRISHDKKE